MISIDCQDNLNRRTILTLVLFSSLLISGASLSCYTCETCPDPFNSSYPQVNNQSGCAWCAVSEVNNSFIQLNWENAVFF